MTVELLARVPTGDSAQPTLDDLMVQVATGDQLAFAAVYDRLAALALNVSTRILRDRSLAEEVTQEAFVQIWMTAGSFNASKGSVESWAATIARRRAVDCVRAVQASRRRDGTLSGQTRGIDEPGSEVMFAELSSEVRAAIMDLAVVQREAIELAFYGECSYREAARRLGVAEGTVKSRIRSGLATLRLALGEFAPGV